jgi:hypothetical protein
MLYQDGSASAVAGGHGAGGIRLWTPAQMAALPPQEWLIDGVLPAHAVAEIHGPPESAKTFVVLDMALSIATGVAWHGRAVQRGDVVYVAAERFRSLKERVEAWCVARDAGPPPEILIGDGPIQLLDGSSVGQFISGLERLARMPALIVLDTLSGCLLGADENSSRDMGKAVHSLLTIREATGSTVLVVHHTTKAGGVERGHGLLRGRMDVMIAANRKGKHLKITCSKLNDHEHFPPMVFRMDPSAGSCVLTAASTDEGLAVTDPECTASTPRSSGPTIPRVLRALEGEMSRKAWRDRSGVPETSFDRAVAWLLDDGTIERVGTGIYRIAPAGLARGKSSFTP